MQLLKKLSEVPGPSGYETQVRQIINQEIKHYVDEIYTDKFGNLIAHKKGNSPKVMIAAHMDEIGFMIKNIEDNGLIKCSDIGGFEPSIFIGEKVGIKTAEGWIKGVITTKKISDGERQKNKIELVDIVVDTGLSKEELKKLDVEIGSFVFIEKEFSFLGSEDYVTGKALDDRVGCYIICELAKRSKYLNGDIFFVFTAQEEVGLYGATTSTYNIKPDWAIVIDVTNTNEFSDSPSISVGKGPCITVKDASMIGNRCINNWITEISKKNKIPIQYDVGELGTSDALNISISRGGVPSAVLGVAIRNIHTTISIANKKDIENTIKILELLLRDPPRVCIV